MTMRRRGLDVILARQWALFTLCVTALFVGAALLLLFVLEDRFIDQRLREVGAVAFAAPRAALPAGFTLHAVGDEIAARSARLAVGAISEFRRADGRYVHVLRGRTPAGTGQWLAYDVSDQLTVNAGLRLLAPWLLLAAVLLALLAWLLSRAFVRRTADRAQALVALVGTGAAPEALRAHADVEPIRELAQLAHLAADAWDARLSALQQERDTLAFLAHELRTPLQSARTSLALLDDAPLPPALRARLQRSIDRLTRASNSVLWLASDADAGRHATALQPLLAELRDSFAPLAEGRNQQLRIEAADGGAWPGPAEVLEAVLANLLLNAIQHGGPGLVELQVEGDVIVVRNPLAASDDGGGFGIGLRVVERLCVRCGWRIEQSRSADRIEHRLSSQAPVPSAGD